MCAKRSTIAPLHLPIAPLCLPTAPFFSNENEIIFPIKVSGNRRGIRLFVLSYIKKHEKIIANQKIVLPLPRKNVTVERISNKKCKNMCLLSYKDPGNQAAYNCFDTVFTKSEIMKNI
jgi:hypothetical protein